MASKKKGGKNSYARKAKKASFIDMHSRLPTKDNVKNTAIETGKDLLIGVIGGGLAGAAIGKPSLLIGIGVTGAGHYMDNPLLKLFGIGLMASNGFQQSRSVNGFEGLDKQAILNRIQAYRDNFTEKLYLDKLLRRNASNSEATNGVGELQFFNYPNDMAGAYDELNGELAALDDLERRIEQSGMEQMQVTGADDFSGVGELSDLADYNL